MRILVLSDSHGRESFTYRAIEAQPEAELVIYLGDGEDDIELMKPFLGEKRLVCVAGNCDFYSKNPLFSLEAVCGKKIFCTHGAAYNVESGLNPLISEAKGLCADIVLYGHTHRQVHSYIEGIHFFNPGALKDSKYGIVDITKAGVVCVPMKL